MSKQQIIDEILTYTLPILEVVGYIKRNIIVRNGPDLQKDWAWNYDFLRFYDEESLKEILDDVKTKGTKI